MSVLILTPMGRDGAVASAILHEVGIASTTCASLESLVSELDRAAAAVISEEALRNSDRRGLASWIEQQPPWSDFPFILLTVRGASPARHVTSLLGNVTLLERPFHPAVLVSAVRSAYRARERQWEAELYLRERQATAERQSLLIRELHHRVKNTLSTVQGLLGASFRNTLSAEEFYRSFSDRIVSLSKTHNLLTEDYWQNASLIEMLQNELGHYDDAAKQRIGLNGPPVELSADVAVPVGMAIHELTTNAAKYGALSVPQGRVEVEWTLTEDGPERQLQLAWTELGGPPVEPPQRKGFGSVLLGRVLTQQCNAVIELDYDRRGVSCKMHIPLVEERLVPQY